MKPGELAESIINTVREPLIVLDQYLRVVTASRSFYEFFKVKPEETAGQLIYDLGNKQWDIPKLRELLETILPEKTTFYNYEVEHDFATIGKRIILLNARQIQRVLGKERIILLAMEDITDRKFAEGKQKVSEQKYRSIFENAVEGIFQTTSEGQYISVNPALARMIGYDTPEELIKEVTDLSEQGYVNPEDRVRYKKTLEEHGIIQGFETQQHKKDGSIIWVLINARAVKDEAGKILYYEGTIEEITGRKLAEKALKESKETLHAFFDAVHESMVLIDTEGKILLSNKVGAQRLGKNVQEFVGTCLYNYFPPDTEEYRKEQYNTVIATGEQVYFQDKRAGRFFEQYCFPVFDGEGKVSGVAIFAHEITTRKQAEEDLKQTMEKLRKTLAGTVHAMSMMVETRDPYTAGHQRKVSNLARVIAQEMGLSKDTVDTIRMAGSIHDIGKISVPAEILSKPGKLKDMEFNLIKAHPQAGYDMLKEVELPYPIAEIVLQHHERLDGSGYPQGLNIDQILLETRIISVADVVEAIASFRPYRPAKGIDAALEEIEKNAGMLYDAGVVEACLKLFREKQFSFEKAGQP